MLPALEQLIAEQEKKVQELNEQLKKEKKKLKALRKALEG